ncbi:hypothetical protein L7F22_039816 [Adiantum nelumboides]|nr:hypothetical protein [Adiantum nelumboides]
MSFPTFNGAAGEDAQEFLDNLEIACLVTGRDDDATRLRVFSLLIKAEAKVWFNTLLPASRGDWAGLRVLFLAKFGGGGETSESLWGKVCKLRQGSLFEYNVYEVQFVELWERWVASLRLGEAAPDFLKKDRFVAGLCPPLREKVKGRFPVTWMDARDIARLKERKIRYQLQQREADQEEKGMAPVPSTNAPAAHRGQGDQDQQELLSRITHQLEDLSVHLVRGGRAQPPNQEQARGPRRQAQEYHCYNCGENGHVAKEDMELVQMDVKTTFSHGDLHEHIYMQQPEGFVVKGKEHLVCKLKKSLYGLKQAPREWYHKFHTFMLSQGYRRIDIDHCLYTKQAKDGSLLILILYVDDMLLAGKNIDDLVALQSKLNDNFDMKDLCDANHILSMQIVQNRDKRLLYLSQIEYINKVLQRINMEGERH